MKTICFQKACERKGYDLYSCFDTFKDMQSKDELKNCGLNMAFFGKKCPYYNIEELQKPEEVTTIISLISYKPETSNNTGVIIGGVLLVLIIVVAGCVFYFCFGSKTNTRSNSLVTYPGRETLQGKGDTRTKSKQILKLKPNRNLTNSKFLLRKTRQRKTPISKMDSFDSFSSRAQVTGIMPMSTVGVGKGVDMVKLLKAVK